MKIFLTGATGFIGHPLLDRLLEHGHEAVALVRTPRGSLRKGRERLTILTGDLPGTSVEVLAAGMRGCGAVLHLANATLVVSLARARAINVEGTRRLLEAARIARIPRFVFTSTLSAVRKERGPYGITKREAEAEVRDAGVPFVILRPSLVYGGRGPGLVPTLAAYLRGLPAVPVIGSGDIELDPIHLEDVCEVIEECLTRDDVLGKTYDLLGPDRVTFNQFLDRLSAEIGVKKPLVHLPGRPMLWMARLLCALTDKPPVTVDNVLGLISPAEVDRESARRDFRVAWTPLANGLPRALKPEPLPAAPFVAPARRLPAIRELEIDPRPGRAIRVGIVGLGKMGVAHTAVLSTVPEAQIVGLCDTLPALGKSLRGMGFAAPFYATLDALLESARPEAVWVCTPPHVHALVAKRCAEAQVATFIEKPLAHSLDDARAIVETEAAHRVPIGCGYTLAFWPTFAAARQALADGALGDVTAGRSSMFLSQVFAPQKGWIGDPARSGGGVVANISSHLLFVLQWALGTPARARATAKRLYGAVEDELSGAFTLGNGAEIGFETSWSVKGYPLSDTIVELEGTNGRLRATNDLLELDLIEAADGWPRGRTVALAGEIGGPARFDLNGEGYWLEDARFLAWVAGAPAPPGTALAGYEVQRMMSALYQSAAAGGETVEVPR